MTLTRKPIHTDNIKLTRALREKLEDACHIDKDGCKIFTPPTGRHLQVEVRGGKALVSARRVAYAFANPKSCVGPREFVLATCGKIGAEDTGHGACILPEHLVKVPKQKAKVTRTVVNLNPVLSRMPRPA